VSQGSGVFLLLDSELDEMARTAADHGIEVSLFARPTATWGTSAMARSNGGAAAASSAYGQQQLTACVEDVMRAARHGFRSVLIADLGLLSVFGLLRQSGDLPADMQAKVSVMLPVTNAAAARVVMRLGADTLNVPTDLSLPALAAIRAVIDIPLDIYVEAPDNLGGFIRFHEISEIIRVASPVYIKFGLRNAPDIYPSGGHLEAAAIALGRERVRRARLALDMLARAGSSARMSALRAADLRVPQPRSLTATP